MRITKKILAGVLILVLITMSGAHVLADENQGFQLPNSEEYQEKDEVLDNSKEELDVSEENFGDADGSYCVFGDVLGCCDNQDDELELEDVDVNEIDVEELDLEDYERMDLLFIASPILYAPDEQMIAVFFEEEMLLKGATLHTRSLVTGEEFVHPYYMIIENTVSFVINHPEGSGKDEILLVSIEYIFEENEEPVILEFSDHGIETSYTVTNEPMPGSEESGIIIYGIAEDGEVVSKTVDIENLSETLEEIIYAIDEYTIDNSDTRLRIASTPTTVTGIAPTSATVTRVASTSAVTTGIAPTSGITPSSANRIIVVSAGHCSTHVGAVANGLIEHELNWHVAGVVVNELNTFPGITAIRDRPTIDCRWPGGGWQRCVTERVHQAGRDGASVFVDIHFNAAENPAANGAEVWIPNSSIDDGMHQLGRQLSDEILRRLSALGMNSRGHRTVPNGQLELATNRIARELGMIGILVEGGFLTNTGDANRLRDPNFRHQLGLEIARGIAAIDTGSVGKPPEPIVSTTTARDINGQETLFDLRTTFSSGSGRVSQVKFAVWGEVNGQNDLRWMNGTRNADGSWTARADVRNHRETGRYQVHAWVTTTAGQNIFTSSTTFNVRPATGGVVEIANQNVNAGTFDVVFRGLNSPSGIDRVLVPVWTRADQGDLRVTTATRQSDGSFRATIYTMHHNFHVGVYQVHAHVTTGNGQFLIRTTTNHVTSTPRATITATDRDNAETLFDLRAINASVVGSLQRVHFAVWSERNGQNDLIWHEGILSDGVWTAVADVRQHRYSGRYQVHVWGTRPDGTKVLIGGTTFNVTTPTIRRVQVINNNPTAGSFDVVVSGISSPSGVNRTYIPVWSRPDQSDIFWYVATRQNDGSFRATVRIANHNFNIGNYHVHAHVIAGNGQRVIAGTRHNVAVRPQATVTATNRGGTETFYDLRLINSELFGTLQYVNFAVWGEVNGQNDLIWYGGTRNADGTWVATADIRNHREVGRYQVHVWGTRPDGSNIILAATTFNVSPISTPTITATQQNPGSRSFEVIVSNVNHPSGISRVYVPVWSRANQADLVIYTATRFNDGTFRTTVDLNRHPNHTSNFNIHTHKNSNNGLFRISGTNLLVITTTPGLSPIMGVTQTNVAQMVRNYQNTGHIFPSAALGMSLEAFAQLVINEANREGVRGEVLWAQVMRETGWLQFGGCVRIEQFNFGGLGATGGGNPGHSFPSVQIGLRAQVHHLVAYATTEPVRNPSNREHPVMRTSPPWGPTGQTVVNGTESPRFHFVPRGISPYVNWLGQGENPNHPGFWAADRNYGAALAAAITVLLNS